MPIDSFAQLLDKLVLNEKVAKASIVQSSSSSNGSSNDSSMELIPFVMLLLRARAGLPPLPLSDSITSTTLPSTATVNAGNNSNSNSNNSGMGVSVMLGVCPRRLEARSLSLLLRILKSLAKYAAAHDIIMKFGGFDVIFSVVQSYIDKVHSTLHSTILHQPLIHSTRRPLYDAPVMV
jgi:hypothetical protein